MTYHDMSTLPCATGLLFRCKKNTDSSNECNGIHATSEWNLKLNVGVVNLNVYLISITEGFYLVATILLGDPEYWKKKTRNFTNNLPKGVADASPRLIGTEVGVLADHVVGISGLFALETTEETRQLIAGMTFCKACTCPEWIRIEWDGTFFLPFICLWNSIKISIFGGCLLVKNVWNNVKTVWNWRLAKHWMFSVRSNLRFQPKWCWDD